MKTHSTLLLTILALSCATPGADRSAPGDGPSRALADLDAFEAALRAFHRNNGGRWPASLDLLVIPDANAATYLGRTSLPLDPWGNPYRYEPAGEGRDAPSVRSLGADGRPGGSGADADLVRVVKP